MTYEISPDGKSITCKLCHRTSPNPNDVEQKYCGHCHVFHEDIFIYTHRDSDGMLWRWVGSRPVSKLADEVMRDCGMEPWR